MPGSLSQPRTCYPPAACSDLVNEFISSVATAGSAPPHSDSQPVSLCRARARVVSCGSSKTSLQCNDSNFASWLESGCMNLGLFFCYKIFLKCQLFRNRAKQNFEGNPWTQKVTSVWKGENWFSCDNADMVFIFPSLSLWIYLFAWPSSLLFLWASRWNQLLPKEKGKKKLHWALLLMNLIILRPKWRSLLQSSLSRGEPAPNNPKQPALRNGCTRWEVAELSAGEKKKGDAWYPLTN